MRKMAAIRRSRRQNRSPQASLRSPTIESWASPTPVQVAPPCSTGHAVPLLSDGSVCTQTSRSWQSRLRVPPTHDDDKMPQLTRAVADGTFALAVMQGHGVICVFPALAAVHGCWHLAAMRAGSAHGEARDGPSDGSSSAR
jgi:hypothetical protein